MTRRSSKKLLFLAAAVVVFALAIAPMSFAGENPGPTQQGEVLGAQGNNTPPATPAPATPAPATPAPATSTPSTSKSTTSKSSTSKSSTSKSKSASKAKTVKQEIVRAKGGVQTGFGGMSTTSGSSMLVALALAGGGIVFLTAGARVSPLRRRQDH